MDHTLSVLEEQDGNWPSSGGCRGKTSIIKGSKDVLAMTSWTKSSLNVFTLTFIIIIVVVVIIKEEIVRSCMLGRKINAGNKSKWSTFRFDGPVNNISVI